MASQWIDIDLTGTGWANAIDVEGAGDETMARLSVKEAHNDGDDDEIKVRGVILIATADMSDIDGQVLILTDDAILPELYRPNTYSALACYASLIGDNGTRPFAATALFFPDGSVGLSPIPAELAEFEANTLIIALTGRYPSNTR